jgi:hypothetical protein
MSHHNTHVRTHRLYINTGPLHSSIVDSNNLPVPWVADSTITSLLSQPDKAVLRDMGSYIDDLTPNDPYSSSMRKIRLITGGFNHTQKSKSIRSYTGYIRMGNQPTTSTSIFPSTITRLM